MYAIRLPTTIIWCMCSGVMSTTRSSYGGNAGDEMRAKVFLHIYDIIHILHSYDMKQQLEETSVLGPRCRVQARSYMYLMLV